MFVVRPEIYFEKVQLFCFQSLLGKTVSLKVKNKVVKLARAGMDRAHCMSRTFGSYANTVNEAPMS